jgi:hypothetical protein
VVVGLPVFGTTIVFLLVLLFLARRIGRLLAPWFSRYAASSDGTHPGA